MRENEGKMEEAREKGSNLNLDSFSMVQHKMSSSIWSISYQTDGQTDRLT